MSAYDPKRTSAIALRMSAFWGKADSMAANSNLSSRLLVIPSNHRVSLADRTSFVSGFRQDRIGDLGPHALTFSVIRFLGVALSVFGSPRHRISLWVPNSLPAFGLLAALWYVFPTSPL